MMTALEELDKSELVSLLDFNVNLDRLLDIGMTEKKSILELLEDALDLLCSHLTERLGKEKAKIDSAWILYYDHFQNINVINDKGEIGKEAFSKLIGILKNENLIPTNVQDEKVPIQRDKIVCIEEMAMTSGKNVMLKSMVVNNEVMGFVAIVGMPPEKFSLSLLDIFARKIDTDIYEYNRIILEKIKVDGLDRIDKIFDSEMTMQKKYSEVLRIIVETIGAYAGYLIIPREGRLVVYEKYSRGGQNYFLKDDDLLKIAHHTIKQEQKDEFIKYQKIALSKGEIFSILLKPGKTIEGVLILHHRDFRPEHAQIVRTFSSLMDSSLHTDRLYRKIFMNFIDALGEIIDTFDTYTSGHSNRVAVYARALGKTMGLTELEMTKLYLTAILHDIGKVGVNPNIIRKQSPLTEEERKEIENHAGFSDSILSRVFPADLQDIHILARHHHEKEDGTGYPDKLQKEDIPILSKIIAIADIFDALTSDRPYRRGGTREQAFQIMESEAEKGKLSNELVRKFESEEVWREIRSVFFKMKVISSVDWYLKEMLPAQSTLEQNLNYHRKCLQDIDCIAQIYEVKKSVQLEDLEDSLLYPADKDRLIQKEIQKDSEGYRHLLEQIKAKYSENLELSQRKIEWEKRFKDEFWMPELFEEIKTRFLSFAGNDMDMLRPVMEFFDNESFLDLPEKEKSMLNLPMIFYFEQKLNESRKLKDLNKAYLGPLEELLGVARKVEILKQV